MSRSLGSRIRKSRKKKSAPPLKTSLKRDSKSPTRAGQKYSRKASSKKAPAKKAAPEKPQREVGKPKYSQAGDYGDELTAAYMAGHEMATAGVGTPLSPAAEAYLEANFKGIPTPEGGESLPISPTQTYSESDKPFTPAALPPVGPVKIPVGSGGRPISLPAEAGEVIRQDTLRDIVTAPHAPYFGPVRHLVAPANLGETDPVGDRMSNDPALDPANMRDQTGRLQQIIRRDVARQFASLLAGGRAGSSLANDQWKLGQQYLKGEGVPQDTHKARELMAKAASKGHQQATDYFVDDPDGFYSKKAKN